MKSIEAFENGMGTRAGSAAEALSSTSSHTLHVTVWITNTNPHELVQQLDIKLTVSFRQNVTTQEILLLLRGPHLQRALPALLEDNSSLQEIATVGTALLLSGQALQESAILFEYPC